MTGQFPVHMAEKIELWPIDRLIPYARNARTHSDDQVAKIAASMTEFGFTNPILVDGTDGIIAGHGRLMAAQKLGLPDVPVVVLNYLTDAQRRAYILADNRLALDAGWDMEILAAEMADLQDMDFNLELTGFDDREIDLMLSDGGSTDPHKEWDGMPEFKQDDLSPFRQIIISFACQSHVDKFAELIEQPITDKTKSVWYPKAEIGRIADKRYELIDETESDFASEENAE